LEQKVARGFERTGVYSDFLGFQYYCRVTAPSLYPPLGPLHPKGRYYSEHPGFGDIYPQGIYELLKKVNEQYPQKEIFISEFGFSDSKDIRRPYWILETVRYVIEAMKHGVPVKGMLLWSLVNNFEWNRGMEQKFGLFDEKDLKEPLIASPEKVSGWEAWRAVAGAVTQPSVETLADLQKIYERAERQFKASLKQEGEA